MKSPVVARCLLVVAGSLLGLFGCAGETPMTPMDPDAEALEGRNAFTISGHALVHPSASEWMSRTGQTAPVPLDGVTLRVQEPIRVALGEDAVFGQRTLDADARFEVADVSSQVLLQELSVEITDPSTPHRFVRSATTVYDTWLEGSVPREDILDAPVYAVPVDFEASLTQAVTPEAIRALSTSPGQRAGTLIEAGFVLGRIVDENGQPVTGAKVVFTGQGENARLRYPASDLSTADGTVTDSTGLFLYVHNGVDDLMPIRFDVTVKGSTVSYAERSALAMKGVAALVDVYPGRTRPQ